MVFRFDEVIDGAAYDEGVVSLSSDQSNNGSGGAIFTTSQCS